MNDDIKRVRLNDGRETNKIIGKIENKFYLFEAAVNQLDLLPGEFSWSFQWFQFFRSMSSCFTKHDIIQIFFYKEKRKRKKLFVIQMRLASGGVIFIPSWASFVFFDIFFFFFQSQIHLWFHARGPKIFKRAKLVWRGEEEANDGDNEHSRKWRKREPTENAQTGNKLKKKKPFLPPPPFYQSTNHIYSTPFCLQKTVTSAQCKK